MLRTLKRSKRNKWTLFVNIFGFSAGLTAVLLLLIFIQHELSYDRHWTHADHIFRMNTLFKENNKINEFPICPRNAVTELPAKVPEIKAAVQIYRTHNPEIVHANRSFRNQKFFYTDSTFFKVFQMDALAGDIHKALQSSDGLVINQRTAEKLFGSENPIGKMVQVNEYCLAGQEQLFRVTAVVPNLSKRTHFDFDILLPIEANSYLPRMGGFEFYTYYLINENASLDASVTNIESEYNRMLAVGKPTETTMKGRMISLKDIYLHSNTKYEIGEKGDLNTLRILIVLTVLILIIAIANFVNLFLVQSTKKSRETGIRKTVGATRFSLIKQFLYESLSITVISFLIAIQCSLLLIKPFGNLVGRELQLAVLLEPGMALGILAFVFLIGILSGIYPAYYLSKFNPVQIFKGSSVSKQPKHRLRKGVVIFQFSICMLLLTNLFVLQKQFNFMNNKSLGFESKNIVAFENLTPKIQNKYNVIKSELNQYTDIKSVTGSHSRPGKGASYQYIVPYGAPYASRITIREVRIQPDYLETFGMQLSAGRNFDANRSVDRNAVVLNEAAVRELGLSEPIGAQVEIFKKPFQVIGVVKNYHYASLREPIMPEMFTYYKDDIFTISIKIATADTKATLERIAHTFQKHDPNYIPDFVFIQEAFEAMYNGEHKLIQLVQSGSLLALILTILGLGSITAITVKQRTKEIGIRKTIGATNNQIVKLLLGAQVKLLFITTILSGVAGLWIIEKWLHTYAYQTNVSFSIFLFAGFIVLTVAFVITGFISYRAASINPVESLRYE